MSATVNQVNQVPHWPPHVLPLNTPRSTARLNTFNRTLCHVQPHAPPRSAARHVTFYTTLRHTSQPHVCSRFVTSVHASVPLTDFAQFRSPILLSSAHRFRSPPLTDFAHLRSPNPLTSARELSTSNQQTHASTNELTLQPTTIPVPNLKFTQHSFTS